MHNDDGKQLNVIITTSVHILQNLPNYAESGYSKPKEHIRTNLPAQELQWIIKQNLPKLRDGYLGWPA